MKFKDVAVIVMALGALIGIGFAAYAEKRDQEESATVTDRLTRKVNGTQAALDVEKLDQAHAKLQAVMAQMKAAEAAQAAAENSKSRSNPPRDVPVAK